MFHDDNNKIQIQNLPVKINYLFCEVGGGYRIDRVIIPLGEEIDKLIQIEMKKRKNYTNSFDPASLYRPIISVFNDSIKLLEKHVELLDLTSELPEMVQKQYFSYDRIVPKNISINVPSQAVEFEYFATLCSDNYQFGGYGTIRPVFFNISLKMKNIRTSEEQIIYKTPDDSDYNLFRHYYWKNR